MKTQTNVGRNGSGGFADGTQRRDEGRGGSGHTERRGALQESATRLIVGHRCLPYF